MTEPVRRSIAIEAGSMSCLEWEGKHHCTMVFAHANGFNARTYRILLAQLSDSLRLFACDLRGHGFSALPAGPGLAKGWTVFGRDLVALAAQISESPLLLAGHSLGATASLIAATLAPRQVRAVVLVEPVLIPPIDVGNREPSNNLALRAAQRRSTFPSFEAARGAFRGRGIFASWPDDVLDDYLAGGLTDDGAGTLRLACSPEWEAEIFREAPRGIAGIAGHVSCPIFIVRGRIASTASDDQIDEILRLRPDTRVTTIERASHFLPMEMPEPVREEIRRAAAMA
ncbi:MAG TPA: alpha/beta hydrolase [Rhizomicrobium sp.]|jgi:pimeloyl-ACP methyl ester carboxylesterase|nr:alpha/beta hydrolase [Rhizomicrobium sp.]